MVSSLNEQEIEEVLTDNVWGHLGCNDGFNTYVYPTNYIYDGRYILCHSQVGSKVVMMRNNTRICFQVDEVENHKNWRSVMVHGDYQELTDERERYAAMKAFLDRRLFVKISSDHVDPAQLDKQLELMKASRPAIYRIVIDEKTGRYENG